MTIISSTLQIGSKDALLRKLDELNQSGRTDTLPGLDAHGLPFLACLTGSEGDRVRVLYSDPDDTVCDQGPHCDDCGQATIRLNEDHLNYPVTVLVKVES